MASEEADGIIIHAGVLTKQLAFVLGKEAYHTSYNRQTGLCQYFELD